MRSTVAVAGRWLSRSVPSSLRARRLPLVSEGTWLALAVIALAVVRLPFLPARLEDIDSLNFDLGMHTYNPVLHQPHPPGFPVFIVLGKIAHLFTDSHAAAIASVSAIVGSLCLVPLYLLLREFLPRRTAALASTITIASPLVWFNSVRPMSDLTGLCAVITAQWLLVRGLRTMADDPLRARRRWIAGVVVAGIAMGVRLQAVVLIGPVLLFGLLRTRRLIVATTAALSASIAAWLLPVVWLSGGLAAYVHAFEGLLADALPVEPLLGHFTLRSAAYAMWDLVGAPWATVWLAGAVGAAAAAGALVLLRTNRVALGWLLLLFVPYALYDYLLQLTATLRYSIPVMPLLGALAAVPVAAISRGRVRMPTLAPALAGIAFVAASGVTTIPALRAYHATPSPAARALDYLRAAVPPDSVVVSGHYMFMRHLTRLGGGFRVILPVVKHDLRPVFDYWANGGRQPVLLLADPARLSLLAVGRDEQTFIQRWTWPEAVAPLLRGQRPSTIELWQLDPPTWFADSGFMVTPEAGPPDQVARAAHRVFLRPGGHRRTVIASGTLQNAREADVALEVGDTVRDRFHLEKEFTILTTIDALPDQAAYVPMAFVSDAPILFTDVAVLRDDRPLIRPGRGFYIAERDSTLRRFQWIAPTAEAVAYLPTARAVLHIRGRVPVKAYSLPATLTLMWGNRPLGPPIALTGPDFDIQRTLERTDPDRGWGTLVLTSSASFVPDQLQGNGDRRALAVRIDEMTLSVERGGN